MVFSKMEKLCPNYKGCRLVNTDIVVTDPEKKESYISAYCHREETWKKCKRYLTRRALWICPDWILPDSTLSEDEIIERAESEMKK